MKEILKKYGGPTPQALCESALHHASLLEKFDFTDIVLSIKSSNVDTMIKAYELTAQQCEYPLHLGVTEAGTERMGLIKSAVGIGSLLQRGIGDTIRVSLTADPVKEIAAGKDILKALDLDSTGPQMISCPSCGRTKIDLIGIANEVEQRLRECDKPLKVAVMGCAVNGPGEAKEADIGIAGGDGVGLIFKKGEVIKKVPEDILIDTLMEEILKKLGVKVIWEGHTLLLDAEQVTGYEVDRKLGCQMRSSIVLLGSLLGRCGQACVPYPGGCVIGKRPVDLHLAALEAMGAEFQEGEMLCARAGKRQESRYHFPKSSVGAAQNAILAAVCAPGITWLSGCSKEPEVSWLCRFLNQAGARIEGVGSQQLKITGVRNLHDTEFQVPADRIAAGTYVCAAAITRGNCILDQAPVEEMGALLAAYEKIGGQYTCNSGKLILSGQKADGFIPYLQTAVYPGFPTDLQSVFLAVLAAARGES